MAATLGILAICFLVVSVAVFLNQRRAKTCPLHNRWVGHAAGALGLICGIIGVILLVAAYAITSRNSF